MTNVSKIKHIGLQPGGRLSGRIILSQTVSLPVTL